MNERGHEFAEAEVNRLSAITGLANFNMRLGIVQSAFAGGTVKGIEHDLDGD